MPARSKVWILLGALAAVSAVTSPIDAQTVGIQPPSALHVDSVRDTALVNALATSEVLKEGHFRSTWYRVISVSGAIGSAKAADDGELVVTWVYIVIGDLGAGTEVSVRRLGPLFVPKVESVEAYGDGALVRVSYGRASSRSTAWVAITSTQVAVSDKQPKS